MSAECSWELLNVFPFLKVLPSGSVRLPTPANNWGGFGIAQWTANELLASLEVRRAELDEDLTKVQTIVNVSVY